VCEGAGSPSSANICSWPAEPGVINSSRLSGGAEPESVREAGRRQPEPVGRDLGLLVAEHDGHQPAGHVEALLLAGNRLKRNANDAASSARRGSGSRSSATTSART
jgi:hypothetical protein